jgi:hypothetical protein
MPGGGDVEGVASIHELPSRSVPGNSEVQREPGLLDPDSCTRTSVVACYESARFAQCRLGSRVDQIFIAWGASTTMAKAGI